MDTVLTSSADEYPGMTEAWLENLRYGWGDSIGVIPHPARHRGLPQDRDLRHRTEGVHR